MNKLKSFFTTGLMLGIVGLNFILMPNAQAGSAVGTAKQKASVIKNMHKKASQSLATAAQDKVFPDYFTATDPDKKMDLKKRIDEVSLNVQSRYLVAEMCVIDEEGVEHSRITGNEVAPDDDLSTEEAGAPFFKQAFELDPKQAASTSIYMSPDAKTWVVAYVSPILIEGKKSAFAHYEHDLNKYRDLANKGLPDGVYLLMVTEDGYIFSDSRNSIPLTAQGDNEAEKDYFKSLDQIGLKGIDKVLSDMKASKSSGVVSAIDGQGDSVEVAYEYADSWYVIAVGK